MINLVVERKITYLKENVWPRLRHWDVALIVVLVAAFLVRVVNLNYNSPFNDEAIYVVIGKMGVFGWDWFSYNAKAWMPGLPYAYPVIAALSYQIGGIIGSRFLNVLLGVLILEEVYRFTLLVNLFDEKTNKVAGVIAATLAGFSSVGLYVSRLAVLDLPSFFFLMFGTNSLIKAVRTNNGKYFFVSSVSLLVAFAMKVVVASFFPFLVAISFFWVYKNNKKSFHYWLKYFFFPLFLGALAYFVSNVSGTLSYANAQVNREYDPIPVVLNIIWENTNLFLLILLPSALYLGIIKRKFIQTNLLLLFSVLVPFTHVVLHRHSTLSKHVYLLVLFSAPVVGYALASLTNVKNKYARAVTSVFVASYLLFYSLSYAPNLNRLEHEWVSTTDVGKFMYSRSNPNTRILTEAGSATTLVLYDKIFPTNITTYDWFIYLGKQDEDAYLQAVKDGYFDLIEINGGYDTKIEMRQKLREVLVNNYQLVYKKEPFEVYEKTK